MSSGFYGSIYITVHNTVSALIAKMKSILNVQGQRNDKISQDINTMKNCISIVRNRYDDSRIVLANASVTSFMWMLKFAFKWIKIK